MVVYMTISLQHTAKSLHYQAHTLAFSLQLPMRSSPLQHLALFPRHQSHADPGTRTTPRAPILALQRHSECMAKLSVCKDTVGRTQSECVGTPCASALSVTSTRAAKGRRTAYGQGQCVASGGANAKRMLDLELQCRGEHIAKAWPIPGRILGEGFTGGIPLN